MRSPSLAIAVVLTVVAVPSTASAAGFDGTYSGTSTEGLPINVQIAGGKLKAISGAAIAKLTCFRDDRTKPFPDDHTQLPDATGPFAIEKTIRGSVENSQFRIGTPSPAPTSGNRVVNSAEGRFDASSGKPVITMTLF